MGKVRKWGIGEVAKWKRWESGEVGRWEVSDFVQEWVMQGESEIW